MGGEVKKAILIVADRFVLDRAYGSFGGNNKQDRRINLSIKEELTSNNNEGKKL